MRTRTPSIDNQSSVAKLSRLCGYGLGRVRFFTTLLLAVCVTYLASCEKKKPTSTSQPVITVTGNGQGTDIGKQFLQPLLFTVMSSDGAPLPNVSIVIETLSDPESSSHVAASVLTTSDKGTAETTAVAGSIAGFETHFKAYLAAYPKVSVEVILNTNAIQGGGGNKDGNVSGETDNPGGGGSASGNDKGNQTGTDKGGGGNDANQGTNQSNQGEDPKITHYVIETEHSGTETAGVGFGLKISAMNKDEKVVTAHDGPYGLQIRLAQKAGAGSQAASTILDNTAFGSFPPTMPTGAQFQFDKGVLTLPTAQGITIRAFVTNMVISVVDDNSIGGESSILKMLVGPLDTVRVASTERVTGLFDPGQEIGGELYTIQDNVPVLVPSAPSDTAHAPISISSGTSITLQVNGRDQFKNLYSDPIFCQWSAVDVGVSSALYPTSPTLPKYLALKAGRVSMNLLVPNEAAMGFIKIDQCQTLANGTQGQKSAESGVFKVVADKPTTMFVDFFAPTGDGNPPATGTPPLTAIPAGQPVWMRIAAGNSLGVIDTTWAGDHDLTLSMTGATSSPGWPLPIDATVADPTQDITAPSFMGLAVNHVNTDSTLTPEVYTFTAKFINGYAWVRSGTGQYQSQPVASRPMAEMALYNSGDRPMLQVNDFVNNLSGSRRITELKPANVSHLRLVFNDSYAVPTGYAGIYPGGIANGTTIKDYSVQVGDDRAIASLGYDRYGNYIDLATSNWDGVDGLPSYFLATANGSKVNFLSPPDVLPAGGSIRATLASDPNISVTSGKIVVTPGLPAAFVITPSITPVAGSKFGLVITAVDKSGATSVGFDTQDPDALGNDAKVSVKIALAGVAKSPQTAWFASQADRDAYDDLISRYKDSFVRDLEFVEGVATIPVNDADALQFFFSDELPVVTVQTADQKISGSSGPIKIKPEALKSLVAHLLKEVDYTDPVSGTTTVYAENSAVNDLVVGAGSVLRLEADGLDRYGNSLGPISVDWANADDVDPALAPPPIPAANYNGNPKSFLIAQDSASTIYAPGSSGKAYISMQTSAGVCSASFPCVPTNGPVVSFTGVIESKIGKPEFLRVVTIDPNNPPVQAGSAFSVKLQLLDINHEVAANYTGNAQLTAISVLSQPSEELSVFGASPSVPAPQTLAFINGEATLSGFVLANMYDSPTISVTAKLPSSPTPLPNGGDSPPLTVTAGPAYTVRVIDHPQNDGTTNHGIRHRPTVYESNPAPSSKTKALGVLTSSSLSLYAGYFDQYGNWVADAGVAWEVPADPGFAGDPNNRSGPPAAADCTAVAGGTFPNGFFGKLSPSGAATNTNVSSLSPGIPVGKACVKITNKGTSITQNSYYLTDVSVSASLPAKLKVTVIDKNGKKAVQSFTGAPVVDPGFQLIADDPFLIEIGIYDAGGTPSVVNDATQSYKVELLNALASDGTSCTVAGAGKAVRWKDTSSGVESPITGAPLIHVFPTAGGIASSANTGQWLVPKAGLPFSIKVSATVGGTTMTPALIDNLSVVPGALAAVNLRSGPGGIGTLLQDQTTTITADDAPTLYAAGYDRVCNYISDQPAAWTSTGQLNNRLVGNLATGQSVTLTPKLVGSGSVQAIASALTDTVPCTKCGKVNVTVNPGKPAKISLATQHAAGGVNQERVTVPFTFSASVLDQNNNVVTSFTGAKTLSFSWDAHDSPTGYQALLPSNPSYTFASGVLNPSSFPAITYPAALTAAPTKRFRLAKPGETAHLVATYDDGAGTVITGSADVVAGAGPTYNLKIYDISSTPTVVPVSPAANLQKPVDAQPAFSAHGFDAAGNDTGDQTVTWSTSTTATDAFYPASSILDRTTGKLVVVKPAVLGTGTLAAAYSRVDSEVGNATVTAQVSIDIVPGAPVQFDLQAPASVVANQTFGATLVAKDSLGNHVASFANGETFHFSFLNATVSPSSASFPGAVDSIPSASGTEKDLTLTQFNSPSPWQSVTSSSFKLTNIANKATLKVRWRDAKGVDHYGQSAPINVTPGPINFYRITTNGLGTLDDLPTDTVSVDVPFTYYANSFDLVGNFIGNASVLWKGTDVLVPVVKAAGNADLVASGISRAVTKVKTAVLGTPAEPIVGTAAIEIRDPSVQTTILDSVALTINPGSPAKVVAYVDDATDNVPVTSGSYTLPQAVTAGKANRYRVEVQDAYGNRSAFNGALNVNLLVPSTTADASLLGLLPVVNQPGTVTFANGLWLSSSASKTLTFAKYGATTLVAQDLAATSPLGSQVVNVNVAKDTVAAFVRIMGDQLESSPILQPTNLSIQLTADVSKSYWAAQFDKGGNWIGLANMLWSGTGALANPTIATGYTNSSVTFTPESALPHNQLGISFDHDGDNATPPLTYTLTDVNVNPSDNMKEFTISAPTTTSADNCFTVDITARDVGNNVATGYNGPKTLSFVYDGSDFTPNYAGMTNPNTYPVNGSSYTFTNGQLNGVQFCLRDQTAHTTITVRDPNTTAGAGVLTGAFTLAVTAGAPTKVEFSAFARGAEPYAPPICDLATDADTVNQDIYASAHDQWGNMIAGYNTSSWQWYIGGVLTGKETVVNATHLTITPTLASMVKKTQENNVGTITIKKTDGTPLPLSVCSASPGQLQVHVKPGVPTHFAVAANTNDHVVATQNFAVSIVSRDQYENTAWSIDTGSEGLTFAWIGGTPQSSPTLPILNPPTPVAPALFGPTVTATFVDGVYSTTSTNRLSNSSQSGLGIRVTATSGSVIGIAGQTAGIVVQPGPAAAVYIVSDAVAGIVVPNNDSTGYRTTYSFGTGKFDALGNFISGNASLTSWGLKGYQIITPFARDDSLVEFASSTATAAQLRTTTISGQRVTGAKAEVTANYDLGSGPQAYKVNVQFNPDPAIKLVATKLVDVSDTTIATLTSGNTPDIVAGTPFYIVVEARDADGNVEATFPASFGLNVTPTAPLLQNYSVKPPVTSTPVSPASGNFAFTYNGAGRAKIGPFRFFAAGQSHAVTIADNDAARTMTSAQIASFNVKTDAVDHLTFLTTSTAPTVQGDYLLNATTLTADHPAYTYYTGSFDQYGNYTGAVQANYAWTWNSSCPSCVISLTGDGNPSVVVTPRSAGIGKLKATPTSAALTGMTVTSPDLTVEAGSGNNLVVDVLFNDQVPSSLTTEEAVAISDLANASAWRTFAGEVDQTKRYQRAMIPFSLRLKAADQAGNIASAYCGGDQTPDTVARVCDVNVTYLSAPSDSPNNTHPQPLTGTTLKVRWNHGYGTFVVNDGVYNTPQRPFIMAKAGDAVRIQITDAANSSVTGASDVITIKPGILSALRFRALENDSTGSSTEYTSPVTGLVETNNLKLVSAGYDPGDNYIGDLAGTWTPTNQTGSISIAPSSGSVSTVTATALTFGTAKLQVDVPATFEHGIISKFVIINIDPASAKSLKMTLVVTDCDLTNPANVITPPVVKAGSPFKVCVQGMSALNGNGALSTIYTNQKHFVITANNGINSDLGFAWQAATPDSGANVYNFTDGQAVLSGFVFTGIPATTSGDIDLIINDTAAGISGSLTIKNTLGNPGFLRIRRGPTKVDQAIAPLAVFNAGISTPAVAHEYDLGGNWIGQIAADWSYEADLGAGSNPRNGLENPSTPGVYTATLSNIASLNFVPHEATIAGGAKLTINASPGGTPLTYMSDNMTVSGNAATSFKLVPENNQSTWAATSCFRMTVLGMDSVQNIAATYAGSHNLHWTLKVLADSRAYPTTIAGELASKAVVALHDGEYVFGNGKYETQADAFCLRDATDIADGKVEISVQDVDSPGITGSVVIQVTPGVAANYGLAETNAESKITCDVNTFVAGTTKTYYIHELDAVGNFLRQIPLTAGNWTPNGSLNQPGVVVGSSADGLGGIRLALSKSGVGNLKYNFPGPDPAPRGSSQVPYCNPVFDIVNSKARQLVITNKNGAAGEYATQPFDVTVYMLDEHGNVHTDFNAAINLTFTATNISNSPYGFQPQIAGQASVTTKTISATFSNGIWHDVTKLFQFPNAYDIVHLAVESDATSATSSLIYASGTPALLPGTIDVAVKAGPTEAGIQIRDNGGLLGKLLDSVWAANPTNKIQTVGNKLLFAALADAEGNFMENVADATWSLPVWGADPAVDRLPDALTTPDPTNGGVAKYDPVTTGHGSIRVTYTGPKTLTTTTWDTADLIIDQAPAVKWRISPVQDGVDTPLAADASGNPTAVAGTPFRLKIEALDSENSVDTSFSYPAGLGINVTFTGTTPAPIPFDSTKPQLATVGNITTENPNPVTITFDKGVGYATVTLYNKDDVSRFTVSGNLTAATTANVMVKPNVFTHLQVRYPQGFGDQTKTILADQTLPINVVAIDDYGNKIADVKSSLSVDYTGITDYDGYTAAVDAQDQFTASLDPDSLDPGATPPSILSLLLPQKTGHGKIKVTCSDQKCVDANVLTTTTAEITINPGKLKSYAVEVEGTTEVLDHGTVSYSPVWYAPNYVVTASTDFQVRVTAVDLFGNQIKSYAGGPTMSFIFDVDGDGAQGAVDTTALTSPAPANHTPQLPTVTAWTFTNGVWRSAVQASTAFKLRRANLSATQKPFLIVKDSNGVQGKTAERIDVLPAALAELRFMDEASNAGHNQAGNEKCSAGPTCANAVARQSLAAGDSLRLYMAGFDADGNYRQDEDVTWSLTSTATPPSGETNSWALSSYDRTNSVFNVQHFATFTPKGVGDWNVFAVAASNTAVVSQLRSTVESNLPTKLQATIIYDRNGNQQLDDPDDQPPSTANHVDAGRCFSFEVRALDANDNLTPWNGTINVDLLSDAPLGPTGFEPLPYGAGLYQTLTFVGGRVITAPQTTGDCAQAGAKGTFVFRKKSKTTPTLQTWFIRVSDGADTGMLDAQVNIAADAGAVDYVALMAGDPASPEDGINIGTSRMEDPTNTVDITNSANWTDPIGCTSIDELAHRCATGNIVTSPLPYQYLAGANPGVNSQRIYLAAFDKGGNFLTSPTGDWRTSKTSLGEAAASDPQWTTPNVPPSGYFPQYVRADGSYDTFSDHSDDVGAGLDVSNTSAIFYYPLKPKKYGRFTAKNIQVGGKTFVVNSRYDLWIRANDLDHLWLAPSLTPARYLAGDNIPLNVSFLDKFNNPSEELWTTVSFTVYKTSDMSAIGGYNQWVGAPLGGNMYITGGMHAFAGSETHSNLAGSYTYRVFATGAPSGTIHADAAIDIFPAAPVTYMIMYDSIATFWDQNDPCSTHSTIETATTYKAVILDYFGNIYPVDHGWQQASGGACPTTGGWRGFTGQTESIVYMDENNNVVTPTPAGDNWCYSKKATIMPKQSHVDYLIGSGNTDLSGVFPPTFTVHDTGSPIDGHTYPMTDVIGRPAGSFAYNCYPHHVVYAGPARSLSVESPLLNSKRIGDLFSINVKPKDKWDNDATNLGGKTDNFTVTWTPSTKLNAPDICTLRGLDSTACSAQKNAAIGGSNREWMATHNLVDSPSGAPLAITFDVNTSQLLWVNGPSGDIYRQVNGSAVPEVKVCYAGTGAGAFAGLVGKCSAPTVINLSLAQPLEAFVTSGPGGGSFYDALPIYDPANPSKDKTFITNEIADFYVGLYDRFGNYLQPAPAVQWSLASAVYPPSPSTVVQPNGEFTGQFTGSTGATVFNVNNPMSFGLVNRKPRRAQMQVQAGTLPSLNIGEIDVLDSPPGNAEVKLYSAVYPATALGSHPTFNVGKLVADGHDGNATFYMSIQVKDLNNNALMFTTDSTNVDFAASNVGNTRSGKSNDPLNSLSGNHKFCNGVMVVDAFNNATSCPSDGSLPPADQWLRAPITIYSSMGSVPRIIVTVTVNGQASVGQTPLFTMQPLAADHYTLEAPIAPFKNLSNSLAFQGGAETIKVHASDTYGNDTASVPGTENNVRIGIFTPTGSAVAGTCASGTAIGSCTPDTKVFKCSAASSDPATNCLDVAIDMTSGEATIYNVEYDAPGMYYVSVAKVIKTFNTSTELAARGSRLDIRCDTDCIKDFDLVYTTPQTVGVPFNLTVKMVDVKGRLINDATLNAQMSGEVLTWDSGLIPLVTGEAPDNRPSAGFGAPSGQISLPFSGGQASTQLTINKANSTLASGVPIPTSTFLFKLNSDNTKTSAAPAALEVLPGAAYEYRISTVDGSGNPLAVSTLQATSSDLFNVKIQALDRGGNFVNTPPSVTLIPFKESGPAPIAGSFEGGTSTCTLSSGVCTLTGLYYRVPNRSSLRIQGADMTASTYPTIDFTFQNATIAGYDFIVPATVSAYDSVTPPSGQTITQATIKAKDGAGSYLSTYATNKTDRDSYLGGLTVTTANNQAGWPSTKVCTVGTYTWTNGQMTCDINIKKSGNIANASLTAQIGTKTALNNFGASISVVPNVLDEIRICPGIAGCATSLATDTDTADDTAANYYINGYDHWGNLRGAETSSTSWTVANKVPAGLVAGTDFVLTDTATSDGKAAFKGFKVPSTPTTVTLRATAPAPAGTKDLVVTVAPPAGLTKLQIATYTPNPANNMTAGTNLTVSRIEAYYTANGTDYLKADLNGSQTLTVTYNGTTATGHALPATIACNFSGGVCTDTLNFQLTVAETNRTLSLSYGGQTASITGITVVPATPDDYRLETTSTTVAVGAGFDVNVRAYDDFGNSATNFTAVTDTITFAWTGTTATNSSNGTGNGLAAAKAADAATWTFTNGLATPPVASSFKLYNKWDATPVLQVSTTSGTPAVTKKGSLSFTVGTPAALDYTKILATGTASAWTNEVGAVTMTTAQTKQLWARGYDMYGNDVGLQTMDWVGTGILASRFSGSATGVSTAIVDPDHTGTGTVEIHQTSGGALADATGTFTINNSPADHFVVTFNGATSPVTAGATFDITVQAKDAENNNAVDYTAGHSLTFTWVNATTAPDGTTQPKKLANTAYTFSGTGQFASSSGQFALYNAADLNDKLTVSDGTISGTTTALSVIPGTPNDYRLETASTTVAVGTGFDVNIRAYDNYGNSATNFTAVSDTVTFAWTGTTATNSSNGTGNGLAAAKSADAATWTFTNGLATPPVASSFKLYNKWDATPTLQISTTSGTPAVTKKGSLPFTVGTPAALDYTKILATSSASAWTNEVGTVSMTANQTKQLWARGYDMYGNDRGLQTMDWVGTGILAGRFSGSATGVSTATVDPDHTGTGTVEIHQTSGGALADATGTVTISNAPANHFVVSFTGATSPVTAGATFDVVVQAKDAENNDAVDYTSSHSLSFGWNNAAIAPDGTTQPKKLANGSYSFNASGQYTSSGGQFALYNATDSNDTLTVGDGTISGTTTTTLAAKAAAPNRVVFQNAPLTQAAGACGTLNLQIQDAYANPSNVASDTTVALTGTGSFFSGSGCSTATPVVVTTGSATATASYQHTTAGAYSITANPGGSLSTASQTETVNAAALASIRLSNTNSVPGSNLGSIGCTSGTTVTCPTLYAFGFDTYGNNIGGTGFTCDSWSYENLNSTPFDTPAPALTISSGHSTNAYTSAWHMNGNVHCSVTSPSVDAATAMSLTAINKSNNWSCDAAYTCNATVPEATCTITNHTGYTASAYNVTSDAGTPPTIDQSACAGGLANNGSCSVHITGTSGVASGNLSLSATVDPAHSTFVNMNAPATVSIPAKTCP